MTKELATIKQDDHIIIFHDKSTLFITEAQQDALLKASTSTNKFIKISGNVINFAGINKILPLGEYYREYPNTAPEQRDIFKVETYEELSIREMYEKNIRRAKGIKEGLLKSIVEKDTQKKQDLLTSIKKTIKSLE